MTRGREVLNYSLGIDAPNYYLSLKYYNLFLIYLILLFFQLYYVLLTGMVFRGVNSPITNAFPLRDLPPSPTSDPLFHLFPPRRSINMATVTRPHK